MIRTLLALSLVFGFCGFIFYSGTVTPPAVTSTCGLHINLDNLSINTDNLSISLTGC